jgi:regulator of ribosome biosynthesis
VLHPLCAHYKFLGSKCINCSNMVVKASEIAPAAFAVGSTSDVQKEDDLTYDLGNLTAFDTHPFVYQSEKELALHARENVQLLINHIFELPRQMSDMGPLALLPGPVTVIPREKPLPKPKVETRWEKFAKEKGIEKRKKSRKVFDENTGEWSHSWGYQRAGNDMKDWAVEMKEGDNEDPWTKRKQEKKARVDQNLTAQAKNLKQGRGRQLAGIAGRTPTGIPVELMNTDDTKAKQRGKDGTTKALEKVQFSTASMGKFDKMRDGESERKVKGKRNHFLPTTGAETTEKERSMNALKRVLGREENAGKNKGKNFDDDDDEGLGKKKKKGKKLKNFTKGATKKQRTK